MADRLNMSLEQIARALGGEVSGGQVLAPGPNHSPEDRSLAVKPGEKGLVVFSHAGDDIRACKDHVRAKLGLPPWNGKAKANGPTRAIVAEYDYCDETGKLLFQVVRFAPKKFAQRRPNGNGGWSWKLGKVRRALYRLPALLEAVANEQPVFIAEGEKAADALAKLGVPATCSPHGAGKWRDAYSAHLKDAKVIILPDADAPGRHHAEQVARSLRGVASSVKVLALPGLPEGGDVYDWLSTGGGTAEKLWTLVEALGANGPAPKADQSKTNGPAQSDYSPEDDARPPAFTDEALALRFAEKHADRLRYVAGWNKWYIWTGTHWRQDDTLNAFDDARKICRIASAECNKDKIKKAIASAKTVAAVYSLARADRRLAATVEQWDADDWLLNTPSGTVDLHTGKRRAHRTNDYITKLTAVDPLPGCPMFLRFLAEVTADNRELQAFLQRLLGYSLTGSIREHILAFFYGLGANGKSVLLNTVSGILSDYHTTAPIETFTASGSDRHPTELAGLRGARLVTATETEEGRRWAEARIKALTGGDKMSARFMRQDFFEFTPKFKLVIAGNHKPGLRSVDEAIRRRFLLVPFTVTIAPEKRDLVLGEKLKAEWPGILQWMVDGCIAWQERGLAPPKTVTDATAAYLEAEDAVAAWIDDECDRDPNAWERSANLFASWKEWAERSGEYVGSTKQFRERLEARGICHKPQPGTKRAGYQGLKLKPQEADNNNAYWNR